jgi:thioester reductase-like protein
VLLLTGGSGLVGRNLVQHLASRDPSRPIVILTRRPERVQVTAGITPIYADLRCENLGIDPATLSDLHARTTEIVHCAADIKFNLPLAAARETNTCGARRLLDFAAQCPGLHKFAHISTLYIAGRAPGLVRETPVEHDCGYFNVYEQSKHEAEHLVFERMARLPISIYRLSSIIGNAATGEISQRNYFHSLVRLIPRTAEVPMIPGDPAAPVDLIADDWCALALAFLYRHAFQPGRVHHLCAGPQNSLTVEELLDRVIRFFETRTGRPVRRPRLVSIEEFDRFRAESSERQGTADLLDMVSRFLPHLAVCQPFDPGRTGEMLSENQLAVAPAAEFLDRVLDHTIPQAGRRIP